MPFVQRGLLQLLKIKIISNFYFKFVYFEPKMVTQRHSLTNNMVYYRANSINTGKKRLFLLYTHCKGFHHFQCVFLSRTLYIIIAYGTYKYNLYKLVSLLSGAI